MCADLRKHDMRNADKEQHDLRVPRHSVNMVSSLSYVNGTLAHARNVFFVLMLPTLRLCKSGHIVLPFVAQLWPRCNMRVLSKLGFFSYLSRCTAD